MQSDDFQDDETGDQGGENVVEIKPAGAKKSGAKKAGAKKGDARAGHNSGMSKKDERDFLRRYKEIREAEADAKKASDAVKDLYRGAKEAGINIAALRDVIKWNKKDRQARLDFETAVETYRRILPDDAEDAPGNATDAGA